MNDETIAGMQAERDSAINAPCDAITFWQKTAEERALEIIRLMEENEKLREQIHNMIIAK